jgi:hypothetical protein
VVGKTRSDLEPEEQLADILRRGLAEDLFFLEEATKLSDFISENAVVINSANFGPFFGNFQTMLGRFLVLQAAKLFEDPNKRFSIRSIKAALEILESSSTVIQIQQRPGLIESLTALGCDKSVLSGLKDDQLTLFTVKFFRERLSKDHQSGKDNAKAIEIVKSARNKMVAHSESIKRETLPKATFSDIQRLIELARTFVATIGFAYFTIAYEDDSGYNLLSADASRSTLCLKRLLQKASVLESRELRLP